MSRSKTIPLQLAAEEGLDFRESKNSWLSKFNDFSFGNRRLMINPTFLSIQPLTVETTAWSPEKGSVMVFSFKVEGISSTLYRE